MSSPLDEKKILNLESLLIKEAFLEKKTFSKEDREKIKSIRGFYYLSMEKAPSSILLMANHDGDRVLVIFYRKDSTSSISHKFQGRFLKGKYLNVMVCPFTHGNACALREIFPYTAPVVIGKRAAFGMGYRAPWGLGNVAQAMLARELNVTVMLAQQSAREVHRTGRGFRDVLDRATWSAFEVHLSTGWGADADHLKTEEDVSEAVEAGYTYFTYDPSDKIRNEVGGTKIEELKEDEIETAFNDAVPDESERTRLLKRYQNRPLNIPEVSCSFLPEDVMRIAVKYYQALQCVSRLYRLTSKLKGKEPFETEVSIDETDAETTLAAQIFITAELKRMRVEFAGLAPRFPGFFEKAIDYYSAREPSTGQKRADLQQFEKRLKEIVAVARHFGYKISVHTGSDKFLIYPVLGKIARGILHVKTAGTTYLEELKVIARHNPELFREIYLFSRKQFEKDRATYQLSTNLDNIPDLSHLGRGQIAELLDSKSGNDDLRQVMHVTYGSVLTGRKEDGGLLFTDRCSRILNENEPELFATVGAHLRHHIKQLGLDTRRS